MPDDSVDLVICSPPYEDAREYDECGFKLRGKDWVHWATERYLECLRVCNGLVAWVVDGRTRDYEWSSTPILFMAELIEHGAILRKPPIYKRFGIPGSGGPDWLKNNYEFVICATKKRGRLSWSDNTAMGHVPKYQTGGFMSNRTVDGSRMNDSLSHRRIKRKCKTPKLANPGNVIDCGAVGGGNLGSDLAHFNEAPYPNAIPEFFIRSFGKPGGTVLDCFVGSGTTCAVAEKLGRGWIGIDQRQSQIDLTKQRLEEVGCTYRIS